MIWDNGLEPLNSNNKYFGTNKANAKTIKRNQWIEAGTWTLEGTSKLLNHLSNRNYQDAISIDQMSLLMKINF